MRFYVGQVLSPWLSPSTEVRASSVHGKGLFALEAIPPGEAIMRWGGTVMTETEIEQGQARPGTAAALGGGLFLADPLHAAGNPDYHLNHSCDPNLWMADEITLVLRRAVHPGEELTADYALWETDPLWRLEPCSCGSVLCRHRITGEDWRLEVLQERYRGRFAPFVNGLILRLRANESC